MKLSFVAFLAFLFLCCVVNNNVDAVITASGEEAPIASGNNVLAGMAVNDAPGSSDLTLRIQLWADDKILVDDGTECTVIMPLENIPSDDDPTGWTQPSFDDSDWQEGEYGIGYGDGDDATIIGDGSHASVYSRALFQIPNASSIDTLRLGVDYDDGFVIWINGVEVARESGTDIPEIPEWDSWTDKGSGHSHERTGSFSFIDLDFKVVGSIFAVDYAGKLASTWAGVKHGH